MADVQEIVLKGDTAVGVRLKDGQTFNAKQIISAAGVQSTIRRLLPAHVQAQPWAQEVANLRPASAHVCLYIGFKGDISTAGASSVDGAPKPPQFGETRRRRQMPTVPPSGRVGGA